MASHLLDLEKSKKFILAGKSTFTVVSKETGNRYTFRVKANEDRDVFFVSYLYNQDNNSNYKFLGTIFKNSKKPFSYFPSRKKTNPKSVVNRTFQYIYSAIQDHNNKKFDRIEFWHEGKCGRCGRKLTVPESIESGLGPYCAKQ